MKIALSLAGLLDCYAEDVVNDHGDEDGFDNVITRAAGILLDAHALVGGPLVVCVAI